MTMTTQNIFDWRKVHKWLQKTMERLTPASAAPPTGQEGNTNMRKLQNVKRFDG